MPAINYKNLVSASDFKAAANSLYKRNMSSKKDMQSALICAIRHMDTSGDWSSSMKPLLDVGTSFGKNLNVALQEWVLKFTWLAYDEKAKAFHKDRTKVMDIDGAIAAEWWTAEAPPKVVPYDFQKSLKAFMDGVAKELKREGTTLTADTIRTGIMAPFLTIVAPEDAVADAFAKVSDEDKAAVITQLMVMVPAPAQVQSEATTEEEQIAA